MPELPEVEVVRRGLLQHLPGRTITSFQQSGKRLRIPIPAPQIQQSLIGASVIDVTRRAKYLLIHFSNGAVMVLHLGMSGKLGIFPQTADSGLHDHACWSLDNGCELRFNDVRRFGSIRLFKPGETDQVEGTVFKTAGPEPFSEEFGGRYLYEKARNKTQPVKNFIMDSRTVVGVGNIYANESLFGAGIRPTRKAGTVSEKRYTGLAEEIQQVLLRAIEFGGSTISDFIGAGGESGYFQVHFNVYGRKGKSCPRCSAPIRHVKLGGRASFFCTTCQH